MTPAAGELQSGQRAARDITASTGNPAVNAAPRDLTDTAWVESRAITAAIGATAAGGSASDTTYRTE